MRIGVIGAGHIGSAVAERLVKSGHDVAIANTRGVDGVREVADRVGARPATIEDAAGYGDVVFEAIPFGAYDTLPADALKGRVVVDASNYYVGRDGTIDEVENGTPSARLVADHLDGARVVKAFNTILAARIRDEHKPAGDPDRLAIPIAGDDDEAKRIVTQLVDDMGFDAVDAGTLEQSSGQEPGTPVYGPPLSADGVREAIASAA
ncbi:MAG: 8-hydroxy-5-deazaflavin:NADPH oxidoreductase, partial [Thermoleophilales bacterium]|jgi:predicted dinucleotide-binding enzyme|nr:8-hydroxy-5-deazaflavin:NADPH oxidoreductase [Thermoleophilales bacterium]